MENFEAKLQKLEKLTSQIKQPDIPLEEALKNFEDGIKLAKSMEKELEKVEAKIQILMNKPLKNEGSEPELDLFSAADGETGTSGAPETGTRQ
ncbi:MAG: exodeoxyribonuclease VII small subunit [Treponema sp.]|nr:exodeoxyribonuclease VII small subunit [Treponema sp.]